MGSIAEGQVLLLAFDNRQEGPHRALPIDATPIVLRKQGLRWPDEG
jgi:hypothetical protein